MTASDVAAADEYRDLPSARDPDSHLAARRSAARAFRPRRTLTAIVVAVLIAAVAGLIAADLISKDLGHPVRVVPAALARDGRIYHWGDPRALVASGVICALGLLLISIAALPGRFRVVPVASSQSSRVHIAVARTRDHRGVVERSGSGLAVVRQGRPRPGPRPRSCPGLGIVLRAGPRVHQAVVPCAHYPPLACPHMAANPRTPHIARGSCVTIRRPACLPV